jgi:hypothetical protein
MQDKIPISRKEAVTGFRRKAGQIFGESANTEKAFIEEHPKLRGIFSASSIGKCLRDILAPCPLTIGILAQPLRSSQATTLV